MLPARMLLGGTIGLCDTVNAEIQVCGQGNVLPGHCVPEDMGVFLSQHSRWQPPPCLFALVTKEEESQTVAQPGPAQGPHGERFQATAGPQLPTSLASRTAPSCHFPFSTSFLISFLKDFEAT